MIGGAHFMITSHRLFTMIIKALARAGIIETIASMVSGMIIIVPTIIILIDAINEDMLAATDTATAVIPDRRSNQLLFVWYLSAIRYSI